MSARLTAGLLVSALIRRMQAAGGSAMVLAKGDATAGAILLLIADRGQPVKLIERGLLPEGRYGWITAGPKSFEDPAALGDYTARRRRSDPDLWIVELDGRDAEAIAAEVIG